MSDSANIRNLESIQEEDGGPRIPRGVGVAFVLLGGACVVFATAALRPSTPAPEVAKADPLAELVAANKRPVAPRATELGAQDVTFPGILSDGAQPTTALAAVRGGPRVAAPAKADPSVDDDRLPIMPVPPASAAARAPVPARQVLEPSPVVTRPKDGLTRAASHAAQVDKPAAETAPAGREGGYQLQVSSFRSRDEADAFASQLRARGHKAHVVEATVASRGTWYRVRIGPFPTQQAAASYRVAFEGKEHVVPFVVTPVSAKAH